MSWAADRQTTRVEDIAYCLLGIFDVNMPLLYGEREKAFLRLQEEIIKKTTDQSIFAWKDATVGYSRYTGLLAPSPHCFKDSGNIFSLGMLGRNSDLSITNMGTRATFHLDPSTVRGVYGVCLDCGVEGSPFTNPRIWLKEINSMPKQYARIHAGAMSQVGPSDARLGGFETVSVRQSSHFFELQSKALANVSLFRISSSQGFVRPIEVFPSGSWNSQTQSLHVTKALGKLGALYYEVYRERKQKVVGTLVILGASEGKSPWCNVIKVRERTPEASRQSYVQSGEEGSASSFGSLGAEINVGHIYDSVVFDVKISAEGYI